MIRNWDRGHRPRACWACASLDGAAAGAYAIANAQIDYTPRDSKWQATLGVTNLSDKYYYYELLVRR